MTLRTDRPSRARFTLASAMATARKSPSEVPGLTSIFARSSPRTWTTAVTESSTGRSGSTTGQPAWATVG